MTVLPYNRTKADNPVVFEKVTSKVMNMSINENISCSPEHQSTVYVYNAIDTTVYGQKCVRLIVIKITKITFTPSTLNS